MEVIKTKYESLESVARWTEEFCFSSFLESLKLEKTGI